MLPERLRIPIVVSARGTSRDVVLDAEAGTPLRAIFPDITLHLGGTELSADAHVGDLGLRAGDELTEHRAEVVPAHRLRLVVVGGMAAGSTVALPDLPHVVLGRGPAAHVSIADRTISVRHAALHLERAQPTLTDCGSRNGTRVDGHAISGPRALGAGAVVLVGRTALRVETVAPTRDELPAPDAEGTVVRHRQPRRHWHQPHHGLPAPVSQGTPRFRGALPLLAMVAPAVGGVLAAVIFHQPALLLLAAVGPLVAGISAVRDRHVDRRDAWADAARARTAAAELAQARAAAVAVEQNWRRAAAPDLGELLDRASTGHALWERRRTDADHLRLRVGLGAMCVRLSRESGPPVLDEVPAVPHTLDLAGGVLGVVGAAGAGAAVARALVLQAAVLHGPADLRIAVDAQLAAAPEWHWVLWLPHAAADAADPAVAKLAVMTSEGVVPSPGAGGHGAVVLAPSVAALPESCRHILLLGTDGLGVLENLDDGTGGARILVDGCAEDVARRGARALARFREPDRRASSTIPNPLLRPVYTATRGSLPIWLGVLESGRALTVDLRRDGPHALVAGTTGAGKSELLRTLVAAACHATPPERLAVLLVDYKGGAALAPLTGLPHVRGLLTDLDGHLARRTLICLEAELRAREQALADAGFADLAAWEDAGTQGCPPSLLVVVDEFASLSRDLDGFVDGLVEVARRGRSLGIHLVLATQRPAGVLSDHIRANVDLRVCLRVQDVQDSAEVLGTAGAEAISRAEPGRGLLRRAVGELEGFRAACVSLPLPEPLPPFLLYDLHGRPAVPPGVSETSLDRVLAACTASARPAVTWPDPVPAPLPERADAAGVGAGLGLLDDPRTRSVRALHLDEGNVAVLGASGAGKTAFLATYTAQLAAAGSPAVVHVYGLDAGGGLIAAGIETWPHVGAVVPLHDVELLWRLLGRLRVALDTRAAGAPATPRLVLLADGLHALTARAYEPDAARVLEALTDLVARGPGFGMWVVMTADRPAAVPAGILGRARHRICLRLADPHDAAVLGLPLKTLPQNAPPGRGVLVPGFEVQIAAPPRPPCGEGTSATAGGPAPITPLPTYWPVAQLKPASVRAGILSVPFGIDFDGASAALDLRPGSVALLAGPPRSGKSATLVLLDEGDMEPSWLTCALQSRSVTAVLAGTPRELARTHTPVLDVARRNPNGILLHPSSEVDADVFHVRLPRTAPCPMRAGRGYLVADGRSAIVQVAATGAMPDTYHG